METRSRSGAGPCAAAAGRGFSRALLVARLLRRCGIVASRAEEYRRRAQQCLEMARTFADRDARGSLCYMAEVWLRLADNYQDAKKVRPAMQQQQQIQPKDDSKKD
jgi:hypothetical protein